MPKDNGWQVVGARVKRERLVCWRTRAEFAQAAGLSERVIFDLENGRRTNFSPETIAAIESTLGWEAGALERVRQGLEPRRKYDPMLARLSSIWRDLSMTARRHILDLAERDRET